MAESNLQFEDVRVDSVEPSKVHGLYNVKTTGKRFAVWQDFSGFADIASGVGKYFRFGYDESRRGQYTNYTIRWAAPADASNVRAPQPMQQAAATLPPQPPAAPPPVTGQQPSPEPGAGGGATNDRDADISVLAIAKSLIEGQYVDQSQGPSQAALSALEAAKWAWTTYKGTGW